MTLSNKSEWFDLDSPIGEPNVNWPETRSGAHGVIEKNTYSIERIQYADGKVVWFGLGTNWVKEPCSEWTKLAEVGSEFIPCDEPIYETLYRKIK